MAISNVVSAAPGVLGISVPLTVLPDGDGDGMGNAAEYLAGTDPEEAASYLEVDGITVRGGAPLEFIAQLGRTYTVEYRDEPAAGTWRRLVELAAQPDSRTMSVIEPAPGARRFYRLFTPATP